MVLDDYMKSYIDFIVKSHLFIYLMYSLLHGVRWKTQLMVKRTLFNVYMAKYIYVLVFLAITRLE